MQFNTPKNWFWAVAAACFLLPFTSFSGEKWHLTALFSPSYETINFRGIKEIQFGTKLSYNFGLEYRQFLSPDVSFSLGLNVQNKGFKNDVQLYDDLNNPSILAKELATARYLVVPFDLNYHWRILKRTELNLSGGITAGYILNQLYYLKGLDAGTIADTPWGEFNGGKSNTDIFNTKYVGADVGFGFTQYIFTKMVFGFQAYYQRQFNSAFNPNIKFASVTGEPVKARLDSIALYLRVGYYFSKQIKNRKKGF